MRRLLVVLLLLSTLLATFVAPALADDTKDYYYKSVDVDLDARPDGTLQVTETQTFVFTSGTFTHVYRTIPLDRIEDIDNVEVWEGQQQYRQTSGQTTGGYTVANTGDTVQIDWWFPATRDRARTFTLKYTVHGAMRVYPDGDQLWWTAVWADRSKRVDSSKVTVHLPGTVPESQLKAEAYGPSANWRVLDDRTVEFQSGRVPADEYLEVRVQFPHGLIPDTPPAWQAVDDAFRADVAEKGPIYTTMSVVGGLFIAIVGILLVFVLWYSRGRDKPAGPTANYLSTPPSDLSPGIVGTLIDEKSDMKDVVATIIDLAQKGAIRMYEQESPAFLFGTKKEVVYELADREKAVLPHEQELIRALFATGYTVPLSRLRNKFYVHLPSIKDQMYDEVVRLGYFASNPKRTRSVFIVLGVVLMVLAFLAAMGGGVLLADYTGVGFCPGAGLILVGLALVVAGPRMPRRTRKGAEEKAKWAAFRRYLEDIEKYADLKEASDISGKYMAYAVAFGIERSWVRKFAAAGAPAPGWYHPYPPIYMGGHARHRRHETESWPATEGAAAGTGGLEMPSLNQTSDGMFSSLSSISDGLFSALQSTANAMGSAPSSSGGGGGGWSGGGGRGGGGGGGGGGGAN